MCWRRGICFLVILYPWSGEVGKLSEKRVGDIQVEVLLALLGFIGDDSPMLVVERLVGVRSLLITVVLWTLGLY